MLVLFARFQIVLLTCVIFFSCNSNPNKNTSARSTPTPRQQQIGISSFKHIADTTIGSNDRIYTNDTFVNISLSEYISYDYINSHASSLDMHEVENKDKSEVIFISKLDTFIFFKKNNKIFLRKAYISSPNVNVDSNISVGSKKTPFLRRYDISGKSDTIVITELEGYCIFSFVFRDDKLYSIEYNLTYED